MGVFTRRKDARERYRCFFATDVHGSDRCFRKFVAAAQAYDANALILGGDVAGKAIVPIVARRDGRRDVLFHGERQVLDGEALEETLGAIRRQGFYPWECEPEGFARLEQDREFRDATFEQLIVDQLTGWCDLAAERLPEEVRCIITPGNDDPFAIDDVLHDHPRIECPEREVAEVGPIRLASLGNTNRTPWDTDREYDEDELGRQIDELLDGDPGTGLVLNFHCPPFRSGLDNVAKLDEQLAPVVQHGAPLQVPVGSTAVREAIERYGPEVGLHGHIHEGRGEVRIGRTLCLNPGSDYGAGTLNGAIVDFGPDGAYRSHLLTVG